MGKMKSLILDMEDEFWDHCNQIITGCERVEDFVSEVSEHQHLMPLHNDSEFTEIVVEAWNHYWEEKGHA